MEKGTEAFPAKGSGKKGRRGAKRTKLTIDETRIVKPEAAVPRRIILREFAIG